MSRLLLAFLLVGCRASVTDPTDSDVDTGDTDTDTGDTDTGDTDTGDTDTGDTDTDTDTDTDLDTAVDPGPPIFPSTVDRVTVTVRTKTTAFSDSDDQRIQLCLAEDRCVSLVTKDVSDMRRGQVDVYHRAGFDLPRADIDRVQLRTTDGGNQWEPACLQVSLDGEPVYCRDDLSFELGKGRGEVLSWSDEAGLGGSTCTTCEPRGTLTHGPMVGATGPDHASIWLRTDATRRVGLRMSRDADLSEAPVVAWAYPGPEHDFTAQLEVDGLTPDTLWHYGIELDGVLVHEAALRTPPSKPGRTTLALGSCAKDEDQPIFEAIDAVEPDVMVFLGDNHYGNTDDLASHRWFYRWTAERPPRAALLDHVATVSTWDDHDFVGDNTDGRDAGGDVALTAFREFWANPTYGTKKGPGAYTRYRWNDVELFLLDGRTWRHVDGFLGTEQTAWLLKALQDSDATFKLVATGSQWSETGSDDSWAAFLDERDALFDAFEDADIDGLVLVSGDIHRSEFRWVERDRGYDLPEITASPIATFRSICFGGTVACYAGGNSFVVVDVDTADPDPTLTARILDRDGDEHGWWRIRASSLR